MLISPLNGFFRYWSGLHFNPRLPPHESYRQLRMVYGWHARSPKYRFTWIAYQNALAEELTVLFGKIWDLEPWRKLCSAVGINPPPNTCEDGIWATRGLFVNIIDLIHWARTGGCNGDVATWSTKSDLWRYSIQTDKIFERDMTARDRHNVVLQHLTHCMMQC
ncbi:uncharacterized protein N7479_003178 [Penicillium vulpinum]|uniref:Uncharacterized protein n=1 Tax=Penicillium vulpinum TaxID=29845 RepID=A0A1V6S3G0_9EURO|nr:uncharacterized protein N7479_003178 [Penicillium vulpinum]KAJ5963302.1 hypothetical protein N7479_003178 [Penicillium vulpinum]OQE08572.1 hypothetical protein PENVUL_c009G05509 [Penicillium vulpinum]